MSDERRLYTPDMADRLKNRIGQKWRPSNGAEGGIFMEIWCEQCRKNGNCPIIDASFWNELPDPGYPAELQYRADGQPQCTAFDEKP
jgi:hypothetical protein